MSGARCPPIPRLNIPSLKVSDGPAGVRGGGPLIGGKKTAAYPVGIALGATWNPELVHEIGQSLAREALDKGAGVLLAPTINPFRSSLNGRNFENYAEAPFLTGTLATADVQGLQSRGVAATPKHFAGNESEYQRGTISSDIPERALRELYLRPFKMVVREARLWAIMTAYNRLDGTYCSDSKRLMTDILRREWGFDGLVMSDWGGTHSAANSVKAGLDLEMPGPARARAPLLEEARNDPEVAAAVRERALNVLRLLERTNTFTDPRDVRDEMEKDTESPETRALIRRAGAEGTVLPKNTGILPLSRDARVAVIGPNAATAQVMGGGSAQMNAYRRVSPLTGLQDAQGSENVTYALGCENDKLLPVPLVQVLIRVGLNFRLALLGQAVSQDFAELFGDEALGFLQFGGGVLEGGAVLVGVAARVAFEGVDDGLHGEVRFGKAGQGGGRSGVACAEECAEHPDFLAAAHQFALEGAVFDAGDDVPGGVGKGGLGRDGAVDLDVKGVALAPEAVEDAAAPGHPVRFEIAGVFDQDFQAAGGQVGGSAVAVAEGGPLAEALLVGGSHGFVCAGDSAVFLADAGGFVAVGQ